MAAAAASSSTKDKLFFLGREGPPGYVPGLGRGSVSGREGEGKREREGREGEGEGGERKGGFLVMSLRFSVYRER